jgi:sterol desaturase/sphingolipid hydroxylase (fatty acid hydroxylase superfamily)
MIDQWLALLHNLGSQALSLSIWLLIVIVTIVPLERMFRLKKQAVLRDGLPQDLTYFVLGGLLPAAVLVATNAAVIYVCRALIPAGWFAFVADQSTLIRLAAIVVVGDFSYYWAHRWAHEVPMIWRVHAIHHSSTQLDWAVASRAHPLEIAYTRSVTFIPVFALGLIDTSRTKQSVLLLAVVSFNTFWGFFIHANVKWRLAPVEKLISTPRFHHWHHANDGVGVANKNYAALLPIWDRLFGTLHLPIAAFPVAYGSTTVLPPGILGQLLYPFRRLVRPRG